MLLILFTTLMFIHPALGFGRSVNFRSIRSSGLGLSLCSEDTVPRSLALPETRMNNYKSRVEVYSTTNSLECQWTTLVPNTRGYSWIPRHNALWVEWVDFISSRVSLGVLFLNFNSELASSLPPSPHFSPHLISLQTWLFLLGETHAIGPGQTHKG